MSPIGTKRTNRAGLTKSAVRGGPEAAGQRSERRDDPSRILGLAQHQPAVL